MSENKRFVCAVAVIVAGVALCQLARPWLAQYGVSLALFMGVWIGVVSALAVWVASDHG